MINNIKYLICTYCTVEYYPRMLWNSHFKLTKVMYCSLNDRKSRQISIPMISTISPIISVTIWKHQARQKGFPKAGQTNLIYKVGPHTPTVLHLTVLAGNQE